MSEVVTKNDLIKILNKLPSMVLSDAEIITNLYDYVSEYGVKNILPFPYTGANTTISGVTYTKNDDGSVTIDGTPTGIVDFNLCFRSDFSLPAGKYKISQKATKNVEIHVNWYLNGSYSSTLVGGSADEYSFEIKQSDIDAGKILRIYLRVRETSGTYDQVKVYPMIREEGLFDGEWQPFAMSNIDLTKSINISDTTKQAYRDLGYDI